MFTMRGTAWPSGAYRQHQYYEDGAPRQPIETISGVLHVQETIFGHKWVYKLNETKREAKLQFKRHFGISYLLTFTTVVAVFIIVGIAIIFTIFGPSYFTQNQNKAIKLPSITYNKTKLIFKIQTISNFKTVQKNITIFEDNINLTEDTTTENIKLSEKERITGCLNCNKNEICFQNTSTPSPECIQRKDSTDPTGCGGLCKLEVQSCQKLDETLNIFSCIDVVTLICTEDQWKCDSTLMCISTVKICDGVIHCYDKSDEYNCECDLTNNFRCPGNISCIPNSKKCDGSVDCWDASDEKFCTRECGPLHVPCYNGECIANEKFCDGIFDCRDKSDEPRGCYNPNVTIGRPYR